MFLTSAFSTPFNFCSISIAQKDVDELLDVVKQSFDSMTVEAIDSVFLSLQQALECMIKCQGGNDYKLPHMGKQALRRSGTLLPTLPCDQEEIEVAKQLLKV